MTESHLRLAADIAERHVVIPFRHGDDGGLLVGAWRPAGEFSPRPPSRLKHATLYHVRDGKPGAFRLPVMRIAGPDAIDVAALYVQGISGAWRDTPARMPPRLPSDRPTNDPFLALGWDHEIDPGMTLHLLRDAVSTDGSPQVSRHGQDLAFAASLSSYAERVREAAREHLIGRLDAASIEVLAFMRDRLPHFSWRTFRALVTDGNGPVRAFAERYPLIAGRALSSDVVVGKALSGDMEGAREAALDPALVGPWVVEAERAHPRLAERVDGRRRGPACDAALVHVPGLPRAQVPTDPDTFAAYVDACAWTEVAEGYAGGKGRAAQLGRMRGNWARASAHCRSASVHRGEVLTLPLMRSLFSNMSYSFEYDLMEHALKLEGGADGPRRQSEWAMAGTRRVRAADDVFYRGMNVPDRIRHAVRYAEARPRIAAVGPCVPDSWSLFATDVLPPGWIGIAQGADIRFVGMGSVTSVKERYRPQAVNRIGPQEWITLPASTPDGRIAVLFEHRRLDGRDTGVGRSKDIRDTVFSSVRAALEEFCSLPVGAGMGDALLERAGLLERVKEEARLSVEARRLHLAAMQAAWGNALPRRLRRLEPEAFRAAMVAEFRATGDAVATPTT